jgi:hypothetical protein
VLHAVGLGGVEGLVDDLLEVEASEVIEKPPKTTEWIAPRRAQASIAKIASGTIGM